MQKFLKVGECSVGTQENTLDGGDYALAVYKDDHGILYQALSLKESDRLVVTYVRRLDSRLGRFRVFQNRKTGVRYSATDYLDTLLDQIRPQIRGGNNSINVRVLTDTHYKATNSIDFYGNNGLIYVGEFDHLEKSGLLHLKAYLGDWVDGSDAGLIDESELIRLCNSFKSTQTPFAIIRGDHDENDKFDEHHDLKASFPENEFEKIM